MTKQNPFSLYDFLGYLIPGALLIYSYLIIVYFNSHSDFKFDEFLDITSKRSFDGVFIFIVISYSLGHLLSFLSSISIEKFGNWKYGYPSKYLIGYKSTNYWIKNEKHTFIENIKNNFGRFIIAFIILPTSLLDLILGNIFGLRKYYQSNLDEFLIKSIKFKVNRLIKKLELNDKKVIENFDPREHDFHRIVSHYAFENCKEHQFRMVNYVALYGFLRNLSLIFNFLSWIYLIYIIKTIDFINEIDYFKILLFFILMFISFVGFMAFMKFYRRYTLEGLMLIVIDKDL